MKPVEADEHAHRRLNSGRGVARRDPVAGAKGRGANRVHAPAVASTDHATLQRFAAAHTGTDGPLRDGVRGAAQSASDGHD